MNAATNARFPTADQPRVGIVRGLPNTYEVTEFGFTTSTVPTVSWQRGDIVRSSQPAVTLTTATPMYDPSDPVQRAAQGWDA